MEGSAELIYVCGKHYNVQGSAELKYEENWNVPASAVLQDRVWKCAWALTDTHDWVSFTRCYIHGIRAFTDKTERICVREIRTGMPLGSSCWNCTVSVVVSVLMTLNMFSFRHSETCGPILLYFIYCTFGVWSCVLGIEFYPVCFLLKDGKLH